MESSIEQNGVSIVRHCGVESLDRVRIGGAEADEYCSTIVRAQRGTGNLLNSLHKLNVANAGRSMAAGARYGALYLTNRTQVEKRSLISHNDN